MNFTRRFSSMQKAIAFGQLPVVVSRSRPNKPMWPLAYENAKGELQKKMPLPRRKALSQCTAIKITPLLRTFQNQLKIIHLSEDITDEKCALLWQPLFDRWSKKTGISLTLTMDYLHLLRQFMHRSRNDHFSLLSHILSEAKKDLEQRGLVLDQLRDEKTEFGWILLALLEGKSKNLCEKLQMLVPHLDVAWIEKLSVHSILWYHCGSIIEWTPSEMYSYLLLTENEKLDLGLLLEESGGARHCLACLESFYWRNTFTKLEPLLEMTKIIKGPSLQRLSYLAKGVASRNEMISGHSGLCVAWPLLHFVTRQNVNVPILNLTLQIMDQVMQQLELENEMSVLPPTCERLLVRLLRPISTYIEEENLDIRKAMKMLVRLKTRSDIKHLDELIRKLILRFTDEINDSLDWLRDWGAEDEKWLPLSWIAMRSCWQENPGLIENDIELMSQGMEKVLSTRKVPFPSTLQTICLSFKLAANSEKSLRHSYYSITLDFVMRSRSKGMKMSQALFDLLWQLHECMLQWVNDYDAGKGIILLEVALEDGLCQWDSVWLHRFVECAALSKNEKRLDLALNWIHLGAYLGIELSHSIMTAKRLILACLQPLPNYERLPKRRLNVSLNLATLSALDSYFYRTISPLDSTYYGALMKVLSSTTRPMLRVMCRLWVRMRKDGIATDPAIYRHLLTACSQSSKHLPLALFFYRQMQQEPWFSKEKEKFSAAALLSAAAEAGNVSLAESLLPEMDPVSVSVVNLHIKSLLVGGPFWQRAIRVLREAIEENVPVNRITFRLCFSQLFRDLQKGKKQNFSGMKQVEQLEQLWSLLPFCQVHPDVDMWAQRVRIHLYAGSIPSAVLMTNRLLELNRGRGMTPWNRTSLPIIELLEIFSKSPIRSYSHFYARWVRLSQVYFANQPLHEGWLSRVIQRPAWGPGVRKISAVIEENVTIRESDVAPYPY